MHNRLSPILAGAYRYASPLRKEHIDMLKLSGRLSPWSILICWWKSWEAYRYAQVHCSKLCKSISIWVCCGGEGISIWGRKGSEAVRQGISICSCHSQQEHIDMHYAGGCQPILLGYKRETSFSLSSYSFLPKHSSLSPLQTLASLSHQSLNLQGFWRNVLHEHRSTSPPLRIDVHGSSPIGKNAFSPFLRFRTSLLR